jgi:hypothetical protein
MSSEVDEGLRSHDGARDDAMNEIPKVVFSSTLTEARTFPTGAAIHTYRPREQP